MPKQKAVEPTHLEVRVGLWRYPRHVVVNSDTVEMEIARTHCSHCPICQNRIQHCLNALSDQVFGRRSAGGGEYFVLPYPADAKRDTKSVAAFLTERLNLGISPS